RALIGIDVVELGLSSLLGLAHAHRLPRYQLRRLACSIAQISGNDGVLRTYDHASGFQPDFGAMRAKMALGRGAIVRIHINRVVRTGLHAGLAANAAVGIEIDDPVLALVHRGHGTDGDAGRLLAMVAARNLKYAARVGENAFLDVLDPGPVHAHRHLVLGFARHRTGVTTNALAVIDYETVFHPLEISTGKTIILGCAQNGSDVVEAGRAIANCHPEHLLAAPECKGPSLRSG